MPCYLQRVKQALMKRVLRLKCRGRIADALRDDFILD